MHLIAPSRQGQQVEDGETNKQQRPKLQPGWGIKRSTPTKKGKVLVPFSVPQIPVGAGEVSQARAAPAAAAAAIPAPKENAWARGVRTNSPGDHAPINAWSFYLLPSCWCVSASAIALQGSIRIQLQQIQRFS